jgi:hypothetical protein
MSVSPLAKKLRLHTAKRALILNAPDGYLALLGETPDDLQIDTVPEGTYEFAHLFVKGSVDLEATIDQVLKVIEYDAVLWISYPKGSSGVASDLNRDSLWEAMKGKGVRPVTQVSVDQVWSALRFRPEEAVGT